MCFSTRSCGPKRIDLDVEVFVDRLELLAQRHEVIRAAHQAAQDARELRDQHPRGFGLRADERRDRSERVEEEMRVDLARERLDLRGEQQLFLLLEAMLDARVVPDFDRRGDARAPWRAARRRASRATPVPDAGRRAGRCHRAPSTWRSSSSAIGARTSSTCQSIWKPRTIFQARRWMPVKTNGEKCQIASFGHSSRRPPPAKPQPMAKGSAAISPPKSGGRPTSAPTVAPAYGPAMRPARNDAFERQVGRAVAEQEPRRHAESQRNAKKEDKNEPVGPVAAFEDEDVPEAPVPHQHGRQRGHHGQLHDERREQQLLGEKEVGTGHVDLLDLIGRLN